MLLAYKNAIDDLDNVFKYFFRRVKQGKKAVFPKLKKKDINDSFALWEKEKLRNCMIVVADRFFPSSKQCFDCDKIKSHLTLSERQFICDCGNHRDRDLK